MTNPLRRSADTHLHSVQTSVAASDELEPTSGKGSCVRFGRSTSGIAKAVGRNLLARWIMTIRGIGEAELCNDHLAGFGGQ